MNKLKLILFFLIANLHAQSEFNFSGYIIDFPIYQKSDEDLAKFTNVNENQFLNLSRLRLRPTLYILSNTRIALEYEIASLYHTIKTPPLSQSDKTNRQIFDLKHNIVNDSTVIISHFIDRFYINHSFDNGNITIGRQRIAWGTGRIWNPTDLFNPINPASLGKIEKDGADAVSLKLNLASFTDLHLVYNPQKEFNNSNGAFRFRTNFSEYDFSIMSGYFDKRIILGGDFAGNLFNAGFRGEGIISLDKNDFKSNFVKFILGLDFQFTPKHYALIEYQFNGQGKIDKNKYYLLLTKLQKGEILNLSRNYIFIQISYLLHPLLSTGLSLNFNLNDGSEFTAIFASYSINENFYISSGGQLFYGDDFDEYWYYPNSLYLKGEIYF